ncbi:hypothetical protein NGA_0721300 [Nannochloropsis gaditana CCMP526]|uniref:uncharacterized protein n=1 Tax=Nannochloropsis gaditana (strain CCMP526) TaxID=1093141 RepID=UPI00029F5973|nr:hypothetical protein NGA_0721300 [Nannochloropsis gaditana CCMP526]EKU23255.1 hypothetical protein NGA_0721300 [Nannochloropsis gaditana CCMP526]|eukprot:XP_005852576.1 hypothetical protein NGA_0721300 [Nannochloropsis gaditana CCMP526]
MRRGLSLLALGLTLALTTGQMLSLKSIKTFERTQMNKDKWSMKGHLEDPTLAVVSGIGTNGLTVTLLDMAADTLDTASFAAGDCMVRKSSKGARCKMMGARVSIRASKPPKGVGKSHNSTGGYFSVSGSFRRVQLQEDPVDFPLTAELTVPGVGTLSQTLTGCSVKGTKTRKVTCVPGPTPAPTPAPFSV